MRAEPGTVFHGQEATSGTWTAYRMSATGRIKSKPKKKNDIREYSYEKIPLRALLKYREQKNKRNLDGRGPVFSWWNFQAPVVDWEGRMGLLPGNRSGVIDPMRSN
jgi:hypothetical protein